MTTASIVTYKSDRGELSTVLNCASDSSIQKIWVVDNSPCDDLRGFVTAISTKIEYLYGQGNVGYGAAHNIAIAQSIALNATYHVVINPDIQFEHGVIEVLAKYMDTNTDVGQVMPKIIYPNGDLQYLCKLLPTPIDLIGRRFLPFKGCMERRNYKFEMRQTGYNEIIDVPFLSGCFMFLRVLALAKTNGFSDKYWMYCEDLDLCRRIGYHYRTVFYPLVSVVHDHKKESYKNKKLLRAHIKSALAYFNEYGWIFDSYRRKKNRR